MRKLLIANRGEIAVRVVRAARTLGITTLGVHSEDDEDAVHLRRCHEVAALPGTGPGAYLDVQAIVAAAVANDADAIHPGYGFLSERADLARACEAAGVTFVGPDAAALEVFGDKGKARQLAIDEGVPLLPGTRSATSLEEMVAHLDAEPDGGFPVVVKAVSGGGGRGVRVVTELGGLAPAFEECSAEATLAFGNGDLYVERLLENARHVEVQVIGDGTGSVSHLWDRDCSVQRRHQKLIEVAPSRVLGREARAEMLAAALRLVAAVTFRGVATVEFLVSPDGEYFFLEVNPRIQVEHTVTEQTLAIDLVVAQLRIAAGASLGDLGLLQSQIPEPTGCAIQVRVNAERLAADGSIAPSSGAVTAFTAPGGPGVRVDTAVQAGAVLNPRFDSLVAKIVVHERAGFDAARRQALSALADTEIIGIDTNLAFQTAILESDAFAGGHCDTEWVDRNLRSLAEHAATAEMKNEPYGLPRPGETASGAAEDIFPDEAGVIRAATAGAVVALPLQAGQAIVAGGIVAVVEAMKMEHQLRAPSSGHVGSVHVSVGDIVSQGQVIAHLVVDGNATKVEHVEEQFDLELIRPDLAKIIDRQTKLLDEHRPTAVAKRHQSGMRTARENIDDLFDDGLLVEYGGLAVAAQRKTRSEEELVERTPADGIITGLGRINGDTFGRQHTTCAVLAYDYTVLAGTQGTWGHKKADRLLEVSHCRRLPIVVFAEGGGGRPNDTDIPLVAGLNMRTWTLMGRLSGLVPSVGIANGRCFAGNAALLGICDVIIATENSSIGMAGPPMVEGAGLGVFAPDDIGPSAVQRANGVIDVLVGDEAAAVAAAKKYLGYFQGPLDDWEAGDQRLLRHLVPENRKLVYDMHRVIGTLFDTDSVFELRRDFGRSIITALARLEGQPIGVVANNPAHQGGAVDADAADKAARFLQLCDAYGLPVVSLCDTPGFMVGPEAEKQATVRHVSRLFVLGARLSVPFVTVVVRKAYGLGAMGMAAGGFGHTTATLAWPTSEFGAMGLEGAVRMAMKTTLEAIADPEERQRTFQSFVDYAYELGAPINTASLLEIDDVLDPAATRDALVTALLSQSDSRRRAGADAECAHRLDTW